MRFRQLRDSLIQERGWCPRVATLAARYYLDIENFSESVRWCLPRPVSRGFNASPMLTTNEWLEVVRHPFGANKAAADIGSGQRGDDESDRLVFRPALTSF